MHLAKLGLVDVLSLMKKTSWIKTATSTSEGYRLQVSYLPSGIKSKTLAKGRRKYRQ